MNTSKSKNKKTLTVVTRPRVNSPQSYKQLVSNISDIVHKARHVAAHSVNAALVMSYWKIGRHIVEFEQQGHIRAQYGEQLLQRLSRDLEKKLGRGFVERSLRHMRQFYVLWNDLFTNAKRNTVCSILPWSHYRRLMTVENKGARDFYEREAVRGGWSYRQLDRQINTQWYERALLSKNKVAMLKKGHQKKSDDMITPEEEIKDPAILEFLDLKDEYSESDLEEELIHKLQDFLIEMGDGFTFVGRQKRLRVGNKWYRIDLLLYHRKLRCLVVIDLKIGEFTHADAGQMNLYLNYVKEHLMFKGENPPVGLILSTERDDAIVHYAMGGLENKVLHARYKVTLPAEKEIRKELIKAQRDFERCKENSKSIEMGI